MNEETLMSATNPPGTPRRIQRQRSKGWRMPEGAVYIGRPSKWGNPFKVGEPIQRDSDLWPYIIRDTHPTDQQWDRVATGGLRLTSLTPISPEHVLALYGWWFIEQPTLMLTVREELAGRDLACWCPLMTPTGTRPPCHGDFLREMANDQPAAYAAMDAEDAA